MGYLNNQQATDDTFDRDGYASSPRRTHVSTDLVLTRFLHTGDVGHIDDSGLLRISDRIKEMIKVKG